MDSEIKIGKVKEYNKLSGVGEVVATDDIYFFTSENLKSDIVEKGDLVKFRAETVNNKKVAFFVDKIDNNYEFKKNTIKNKIYYSNNIKKNDSE